MFALAFPAALRDSVQMLTYHNTFSVLKSPVREVESEILERRKSSVDWSIRVLISHEEGRPCIQNVTPSRAAQPSKGRGKRHVQPPNEFKPAL